MMDALIAGRLHAAPQARTGKNGKTFATAKVRATAGDGEGLFVNVITFDEAACTALLALAAGDALALAGSITPKAWTDKDGNARPALDLVAHQVLTPYRVNRKRRDALATPPELRADLLAHFKKTYPTGATTSSTTSQSPV